MSIDVKLHYDLAIAIISEERSSLKFSIDSDIFLINYFLSVSFLNKKEKIISRKKCRRGFFFQESIL